MSWIHDRFRQFGERPVAVDASGSVSYADFLQRIERWREAVQGWGITAGDRVALLSEHHIDAVALLLALIETGCIVIPLAEDDRALFDERLETACATHLVSLCAGGTIDPARTDCRELGRRGAAVHPLMQPLVGQGRPGYVFFTSGSTGKGKAVLLDHARVEKKYLAKTREGFRTLLFLKLDHFGGLNTLFSVIFNGGTVVTSASRRALDICAAIESHRVDLLPTTPSFLTMLLMSGLHRSHDLTSLKIISYGTEVMPSSTLAGLHQEFPGVMLKQTYGVSEIGVLATQSKDSASKWMKIGGEGIELQVRNGTLWIRSEHAMLGYLNAPSPFDADGWYDTGDQVEVDGDYFHILGRASEIINVGGEKVFPAEVESFLLTLPNVRDVIVREKKSPVLGQMVWAEFLLEGAEELAAFRKRVIAQCQGQLAPFKVPGFITVAPGATLVGSRFKKIRHTPGETSHA